MPADFWPQAIASLLIHEGGSRFVNDARDPGGATRYGISLRFARGLKDLSANGRPMLDVDGDGDVDAADIAVLPRDAALKVYRTEFWDPMRCGELPGALALALLDSGVNQGRGPAVTMLQTALQVTADGKPGPGTIAAALRCAVPDALAEFMARRAARYATTHGVETFGLGWMRRIASVHQHALSLCGVPPCPT